MNNGLEINFLAVGNGEKSGDAIAIRYGNLSNPYEQRVIIIDGGTIESGRDICKLVKETYHTNHINVVICTHPDGDHASGLREVLRDEELIIDYLFIHQPWNHSKRIRHFFKDGRITDNSLSERLKEAYTYAYECEQIAIERGIIIREPFSGLSFDENTLMVLGPDRKYYHALLPEFNRSPEMKEALTKSHSIGKASINWIRETPYFETLDESGETSAENNSSVILSLNFENNIYLFTGDAGIPALKRVIKYTKENGIDISSIQFMQAPHHGSKRNISPSILDSIRCKTVCISASKNALKHPAKKVINAYIRRGANVYTTEGTDIFYSVNAPSARHYNAAIPQQFYDKVEE